MIPLPQRMDLNLSQKTETSAGSDGSVSTPFDEMMPWLSTKNYNNHSAGSTQNGSASANKAGGMDAGGLGGLNMTTILIIGFVVLMLRR